MSLARLLSAGKSLVGLKGTEGRYQLPNSRVMPRFEAKTNPFRDSAVPAHAGGCVVQEESREPAPPAELPAAQQPGRPPMGPTVSKDSMKRNVFLSLRGLFQRNSAERSKPASARAVRLVQGELSLDRVKVVRNDLRDSDLEVVAAAAPCVQEKKCEKPAGTEVTAQETGGEARTKPEPRPRVSGMRLVGKWLGAGKQ